MREQSLHPRTRGALSPAILTPFFACLARAGYWWCFAREVDDAVRSFTAAVQRGDQTVIDSYRTAFGDRIDELEEFYLANDDGTMANRHIATTFFAAIHP